MPATLEQEAGGSGIQGHLLVHRVQGQHETLSKRKGNNKSLKILSAKTVKTLEDDTGELPGVWKHVSYDTVV